MKFEHTLYEHVINILTKRHIKLAELADLVYEGQNGFNNKLTKDDCYVAILHVLKKREVQNAIVTGIYLDDQSKKDKHMDIYLKAMLNNDEGQYQIDELLSTAVSDVFGGIANSNRGFLDRTKPGIIGEVDSKPNNVFLDDLLASIVAGAEAYVANKYPTGAYKEMEEKH